MVILLDIDGVMVPAAGWKAPEVLLDGFPKFSIRAVKSLNKILASTNATILLTTSHKSKYDLPTWIKIFGARGIHAKIAKLKDASEFQSRKDEVLDWLQTHEDQHNFVIIDDDKSLNALPSDVKEKVILTSPLIGLNEDLADQAILALSNSTSNHA